MSAVVIRTRALVATAGAVLAATVALAGCTSSHHASASTGTSTGTSTGATSPATPTSSLPSVVAPLLPGKSESTPSGPWSKAYAGQQFTSLVQTFSDQSGGSTISSTSTFPEYVAYSQRIATACDPFLTGLREGKWPANVQLPIVQYLRIQQVVCDVELARGQAASLSQYKGVPPAPADSQGQLLDLRVKIYNLLGV